MNRTETIIQTNRVETAIGTFIVETPVEVLTRYGAIVEDITRFADHVVIVSSMIIGFAAPIALLVIAS